MKACVYLTFFLTGICSLLAKAEGQVTGKVHATISGGMILVGFTQPHTLSELLTLSPADLEKVGAIAGVLALLLYLLAAFIVFDMGKPAYAYDEETHNGKDIALGPRPRTWACKPTHHDVAFDGHEWPFKVFGPVCGIWRLAKGYERPAELRRQ